MNQQDNYPDLSCDIHEHIATVQIKRPPYNFFDLSLIRQIADLYEELETNQACRVIILCAEGKAFCAGANFNSEDRKNEKRTEGVNPLYLEAIRIFSAKKPSIALIQGPAIGGGLGLALTADFRIGCAESRFSANFCRLGFHPGFALSHTLPRLIGKQKASELFFTGRRINGQEAYQLGLLDRFVAQDKLMEEALSLAKEIAISSPRAVVSVRETMRQGLIEELHKAVVRESAEQFGQMQSDDFKEGVAAMTERRNPRFA